MANPLKRAAKSVMERAVAPALVYLRERVPASNVLRELEVLTARECADYALQRMQAALEFRRRQDLWDHTIRKAPAEGILAEFGVWKGESVNHLARRVNPRVVYGFDSFEGLKEDWAGWREPKGAFSLGGRMPAVEPNVRLVKGWFDTTLPGFLKENTSSVSLVHLDSDTYESTSTVLGLIGGRIVTGTVLIFDEYFGYRGWRLGEFKAWQEFVAQSGLDYEYLAFSTHSVSVRVTRR
jgi:hypothetical protein